MRRLFERFDTKSMLAGISAGAVLLTGSILAAGSSVSSVSAARPGPSRAAAGVELHRLLQQGLLAPGHRASKPGARDGALTQVSYYNWSGYADDNSTGKKYSKVSGSWTQPKVTCPSKEDAVAVWWVGLDGFQNSTVEQDGTLAQCYQGGTFYYSWWEMFPTNNIQTVGATVAPGDKISASVNFASGNYTLALTDATATANSFSLKEQCASGLTCARASAEWIAETPSTSHAVTRRCPASPSGASLGPR